ncbi:phosphate acetyltransferase [Puniceicoccaceae bacterium K14]|nr:phosphate acetyltransferase [Puniceicoccaceae bacterium K14]
MNLIESLIAKLQRHPKRFVFPDGNDARVLQAARQIVSREMGVPMLIGDRTSIKDKARKLGLATQGMRIIEIERSDERERFAQELSSMPRYHELSPEEIEGMVLDPNVFASLMLRFTQAEALISGATGRASNILRPLFKIVGTKEGVKTASSLLILDLDEKQVGIDGALFMGDCGVIPNPTADQLAEIAISTASLAHHLTNSSPKVALLSYATHGRRKREDLTKIREAKDIVLAKKADLDFKIEIEGEIQVDAALDPATAITKGLANNPVAGKANVLIFPDLNSGNIASKLVQILTGANTYGQIIMGLDKPAAEISRGASAHDILGAAAIVGCQAIDRSLLFHPTT